MLRDEATGGVVNSSEVEIVDNEGECRGREG